MRILVADDHELIANGVISYYAANFPDFELSCAKNKSELVFQLREKEFDVLLQDLQFGKDDGRELLELVKSIQPEIKTLVLSSHIDSYSVKSAMAIGFDGYISKNAPVSEIPTAIDAILNGETYYSKDVAENVTNNNTNSNQGIVLSDREKQVLFDIQNELSTKEIANKIHLSEKTVEVYRSNLFSKFQVKNVAGLVKQSILHGYVSPTSNDEN